jgi:MFS transporter, DHA2 family, multidrug resistance protein
MTSSEIRNWIGYIAMCLGMFMAILDIQVVVTSLPTIEQALSIGVERMSWIQTAYIVAEVIAIPLTGLLIRVFSMRLLFAGALLAFTLASIGCSSATGFASLVAWRVAQGFAGGVLIPLVFSGIFLLFPKGWQQTLATAIGGILAVFAPTIGPVVGGWLTENYSWPYLFLINVPVGIVGFIIGLLSLPRDAHNITLLKRLDYPSLIGFGLSLALLIIGLKEAPQQGWLSVTVLGCFAMSMMALIYAVKRPNPAVMFELLNDRALAFGCILSFLLGMILFSSVYLLPLFFALVKNMNALQIGIITVVMGAAQLAAAPITVGIDRFFNARALAALGFVVFAIGLALNASLTPSSTADDFFWPQIIRGASIALCILPPIRFALALMPLDKVSDASGLFNVSRNIGGAIGIALTDTILFSRVDSHIDRVIKLLDEDPQEAARLMGMDISELPVRTDPTEMANALEWLGTAGLTMAMNEAWLVMSGVALSALVFLFWVGPIKSALPVAKLQAATTKK